MAVSEYVGTREAADLLKVEVQRISRYRKVGKMPPTAVRAPGGEDLAATPVWRRKDVLKLARSKRWQGDPPEVLTGCGTSEAADVIGGVLGRHVDKSQIGRWRRAKVFPEPWFELAATPVWKPEALEQWARERREADEQTRREQEARAREVAQRAEARRTKRAAAAA